MNVSRRSFAGAAAVALSGKLEALAAEGGPKSVTVTAERHAAVTKWPRYTAGTKRVVSDLLESNRFYAEIPELEQETCAYLGAPFAKAHCNGTSALMSMFFAVDLPAGSEVLVPSYTASASIVPMRFFGLVPVFVDVDPATACLDAAHAERQMTGRVKAIVPMHAWGLPCEMDAISALAKKHGLYVLEDAAQAQGASFGGRKVGTWGEIGVFSFQTSKVLAAIEGGIACYRSRDHYERATAFGNYDLPGSFPASSPWRKYHDTGFGPKFRIHPLAAAIARDELRSLDARNARTASLVRRLNGRITQLPGLSEQRRHAQATRVHWAGNVLFLDEAKARFPRAALVKALAAEGVRVSASPYPEQHQFTIYREAKWWHHAPRIPEALPGCAQVNRTSIRLPLFHEDDPDLIEQYATAFEKVWAHRAGVA